MTKFQALLDHHAKVASRPILDLFGPHRAANFSVTVDSMMLDYSKTNIDETALGLLLELAEGAGLEGPGLVSRLRRLLPGG